MNFNYKSTCMTVYLVALCFINGNLSQSIADEKHIEDMKQNADEWGKENDSIDFGEYIDEKQHIMHPRSRDNSQDEKQHIMHHIRRDNSQDEKQHIMHHIRRDNSQ